MPLLSSLAIWLIPTVHSRDFESNISSISSCMNLKYVIYSMYIIIIYHTCITIHHHLSHVHHPKSKVAMASTCCNPFLYSWLNENFRFRQIVLKLFFMFDLLSFCHLSSFDFLPQTFCWTNQMSVFEMASLMTCCKKPSKQTVYYS